MTNSIKDTLTKGAAYLAALILEVLKIPIFAAKEINIIKSQKFSYFLVFLYPILAIVSISLVISGTTSLDVSVESSPHSKLSIGVYSLEGFGTQEIKKELEAFDYLTITEFSDKQALMNALTASKISLGIEIIPPKDQYSEINTNFFYDNSNFVAASTIVGQVKTAVQNIGLKKSGQTLSLLLSDLNSIEYTLNSQLEKTNDLLFELTNGDKDIENLQQRLEELKLDAIKSKLEQFDIYYTEGKTDIALTLADTNTIKEKIQVHKSTVQSLRAQIQSVREPLDGTLLILDSAITELQNAGGQSTAAQLEGVRTIINEQVSQLDEIEMQLQQAESDLNFTQEKISSAESKLILADSRLDIAQSSINEIDQNITQMEVLIASAQDVIKKTQETKNKVKGDLQNAQRLMQGLIRQLGELRNYSPEYLSNPIRVQIEPIYDFSKVTALLPFTIALVLLLNCLLLASTSMINEQNWGILFRLQSSPTTLFSWLAGKISGQTLVALFESIIIFVVGILFFAVPLPAQIIQVALAIILISITFISIGIFITNFMKTASNSIFTALLFIVPMLFLSGIIVPIEFMPDFLATIARVLPLTASIELLQATYLRQQQIVNLLTTMLPLIIVSIFCLAFTYFYMHQKK